MCVKLLYLSVKLLYCVDVCKVIVCASVCEVIVCVCVFIKFVCVWGKRSISMQANGSTVSQPGG